MLCGNASNATLKPARPSAKNVAFGGRLIKRRPGNQSSVIVCRNPRPNNA